jgi:hypothetical protein
MQRVSSQAYLIYIEGEGGDKHMATAELKETKIQLVFDNGLDEKGKPKVRAKSFANINMNATPAQIENAAQAIASLSSQTMLFVERNDSFDIQA